MNIQRHPGIVHALSLSLIIAVGAVCASQAAAVASEPAINHTTSYTTGHTASPAAPPPGEQDLDLDRIFREAEKLLRQSQSTSEATTSARLHFIAMAMLERSIQNRQEPESSEFWRIAGDYTYLLYHTPLAATCAEAIPRLWPDYQEDEKLSKLMTNLNARNLDPYISAIQDHRNARPKPQHNQPEPFILHDASFVFRLAQQAAQKITDPESQTKALTDIAAAITRSAYDENARATLGLTLLTSRDIDDPAQSAKALKNISATYATLGDHEPARAAFADAMQSAAEIEDEYDQGRVLSDLVSVLVGFGQVDEALHLTVSIEDINWKLLAKERVLSAMAGAGRYQEVCELVMQSPSREQTAQLCRDIVVPLAESGQFEHALSVTHCIGDPSLQIPLLLSIASAKAAHDHPAAALRLHENARQLALQATDARTKAHALNDIASSLVRLGEMTQARAVLDEAVCTAYEIRDEQQRFWPLRSIAQTLVSTGELLDAQRIAQDINAKYMLTEILLKSAAQKAEAGDQEGAHDDFAQARAIAETAERPHQKAWNLSKIAVAMSRAGDQAGARSVFTVAHLACETIQEPNEKRRSLLNIARGMQSTGETETAGRLFAVALQHIAPDEDQLLRDIATYEIASSMAESGRIEEALNLAEPIADQLWRDRAMNNIAANMIAAGRYTDARDIAQRISDTEMRDRAWYVIATDAATAGHTATAMDTAAQITSNDQSSITYYEIAETMRIAGKIEEALRAIEKVTDPTLQARAAHDLITDLLKSSRLMDAFNLAEAIGEPRWRALASHDIAVAMAKSGHYMYALFTADRIQSTRYKTSALYKIAEHMAQNQKASTTTPTVPATP